MYYIISLKHTHKTDKFITLWGPDNKGYCCSLDNAGVYSEIKEGYHNSEGDSIPFPVGHLDGLFIDSKVDSQGTIKKCIPNCKQVWDFLNLKMTKRGLIIN